MPELPEVETTARFLKERILGQVVKSVNVLWPRTVATHSPKSFSRVLTGAKIVDVGRRGKYVLIKLDKGLGDECFLFGHMRMSGSFDVLDSETKREKHDRIVISLENSKDIRFHDPRKFGRFFLTEDQRSVTDKLGIEPLSAEFTTQALKAILAKHKGAIKTLLLNQKIISGIGNIYADESLWYAKIHPLSSAGDVSIAKINKLHDGIQKILIEAIAAAGTDFGDGVVEYGGYVPKVYGREGKNCHRCKKIISKIVVGQRGTHFCPKCQLSDL